MAEKKIITVFGATGKQGGAIVNTFLNDPKLKNGWKVRGVTRDVTKDAAKKLQSQGAEVVAADMDDKSSLVKAMTGSYAVFAVTNYWEKLDMKLEMEQGKALADAAKETGVKHFIWSSLFNVTELTNGKLPGVYHFDGKAKVEAYTRELGIPATFFIAGFYMSNLTDNGFKQESPDKPWVLALPVTESAPFPMFEVADTGKYVKAIVLNREALLGKRLLASTGYLTPKEIVAQFQKASPEAGKGAMFVSLPHDDFRQYMTGVAKMPDFVAEEMLQNYRLLDEAGYYGGASLDETHRLVEDHLTTWVEHMKASKAMGNLK